MTPAEAVKFLQAAAKYFEARPTKGEDRAHWSNVYNAESCLMVADMIRKLSPSRVRKPNKTLARFRRASGGG